MKTMTNQQTLYGCSQSSKKCLKIIWSLTGIVTAGSVKQLSKALFRQINGKWTGSYISLFYSTFLHIPMIREQLWVSVSFPQMLGHC